MRRRWLLFILLFLIIGINGFSQSNNRPKLGLVLSGGGAKGMAHIGVIKAMEEAGLYPDYITGTSMGSIIGALYAIGYSANEIKEIALGIKWDEVLTNTIPFNRVAFEEKAYYGRYIMEFPIRNNRVSLPQGLIEGQELTMVLSNMTRPAHTVNDFNKLPIPFACVAADIENGEADVLSSGSLPEAIRASMSIPSVFTPTLIDSTLYVDGGLLRNFPVQEVMDMGADIVIGVFVSSDLLKKDELNSMVDVLSQSAFVFSAHDSNKQKKLVDIYIEPDLALYSTGSFSQTRGIIVQGEKSGQENLSIFKALADSLDQFGPAHLPKRPKVKNTYVFEDIRIEGNNRVPEELILGKLRIHADSEINIKDLESRINLLYGTLYFEKVAYTIDEKNKTLIIKVKEGSRGSLKMAAHYDTDNKAGINVNLTYRNFLLPSSRFIVEYDLAQNPTASLNYFKYLGKKQNMAVVFNGVWLQSEIPGYWDESSDKNTENSGLTSLLEANVLNPSIGFQGTYKSNSTIGVKFQYLNHSISPLVLDSISISGVQVAFERMSTKDWGGSFYFRTNTLNRPFFPDKGIRANVTFDYLFNRQYNLLLQSNILGEIEDNIELKNHIRASIMLKWVVPLINKLSLLSQINIQIGNGNGDTEWIPYQTFIGGDRPIGWSVHVYEATPSKRFSALNYSALSLGLQYEMFKNLFLTAKVDYLEGEYPMKWINTSIFTANIGAYPRRLGFNAKVSYNSIVGPIEFGIGKDQYLSGIHGFFGFGYFIKR